MTLDTNEFNRRFLILVLPCGLHRIRNYGLFAAASRAKNIARAWELLATPTPDKKQNNVVGSDSTEPPAGSRTARAVPRLMEARR